MPISSPSAPSIIPAQDTSAGNVKRLAAQLSKVGGKDGQAWAYAGDAVANLQRQTDHLTRALQQPVPIPNPLQITAADGSLIAQIGSIVDPTTNTGYSGIWGNNLYVGGQGPSTAPFFATSDGSVVVGQNGQVDVLDPFGNIGAWLGTQVEAPRNVTGAVADGSGQVQLTVTAHPYRNGDWVNVQSVGGVPGATGQWLVGLVAANTFSLLSSHFSGTYTSGGTATRYFAGGAFSTIAVAAGQRITNVINNGSGLCRLTIVAHGYLTGFAVVTTNVQGVPGANGDFLITVIDADTFDLIGSVFSGAYISGGISINWPTAKLLAQGNGDLLLNNAEIISTGAGGTSVVIANGVITLKTAGSTNAIAVLSGAELQLTFGNNQTILSAGALGYLTIGGEYSTFVSSLEVNLFGYTGATGFGPLVIGGQARGTLSSPTPSQNSDVLTGLAGYGWDGGSELPTYAASVLLIASQNHSPGAHGASIAIVTTPNGSATPATIAIFDQSGNMRIGGNTAPSFAADVTGDANVSGVYRKGGTAGLSVTRNMVASLTTVANGVIGTPGVGQANTTVVTGITLTSSGFSGGILTS